MTKDWIHPIVRRILFQLTSSRRGWRTKTANLLSQRTFQLTSSRRGWHLWRYPHEHSRHFNSHPHEEDDCGTVTVKSQSVIISTHILTKRMTECTFVTSRNTSISTHILTKRMTVQNGSIVGGKTFQLTSSRRGWRFIRVKVEWSILISTHILTKRMTIISKSVPEPIYKFQLTSSRRGWRWRRRV